MIGSAATMASTTKKKRTPTPEGALGQLNVRVPEPLLVRLGVYRAKNRGLTQRVAVAEALDEYLKKRGG